MRIPTSPRQTETDTADTTAATPTGATPTGANPDDTAPVRPRPVDADLPPAPEPATRADLPPAPTVARADHANTETYRSEADRANDVTATDHTRVAAERAKDGAEPVVTGPKPRASLLATLGLIFGVAGALLVLSGPLLGYGIGVAGVALVLSLLGIRATGKRHVAGKSDALIGMVLALAAIVVGVLALTGSLSWLGTDMHPVNSLREWLDAQFANRF